MARKKVKLGKGFYMYPGGKYVREKLASRRGCRQYRVKEVKPGRKVLLCVQRGRTRAVALLRSLKTKPKNKDARRAIMKAKKYRKKTKKKSVKRKKMK